MEVDTADAITSSSPLAKASERVLGIVTGRLNVLPIRQLYILDSRSVDRWIRRWNWIHSRSRTGRNGITTDRVGGGHSRTRGTCRTWNRISGRGPGVRTITSLVTRAATPSAETVEWAGSASVAELPGVD